MQDQFVRPTDILMYDIIEVDGVERADLIHHFNALCSEIFPNLEQRHLENGYWWVAYWDGDPVAFSGLVPMSPFEGYGYLKRCYVLPDHHGHGLQLRMMVAREVKARQIGWTHLVSECGAGNSWSASNFRRAGFDLTEPEQKWGAPGSIYWIKSLV